MRRLPYLAALAVLVLGISLAPRFLISKVNSSADFVNFESAQVHPLATTPDNTRLLAVNTPDNRLVVFDITGGAPVRTLQIPVGLDPVAVCARNDTEAWVVNHLSDDVSVVDLSTGNVKASLRVGDEPFDVVFAGSPERAYVSVGQENVVKVYDPADLSAPPDTIQVGGRKPRTLATNPAKTKVYVAIFESGNRTSIVPADSVGAGMPAPDPPRNPLLGPAPAVGLIVQEQGANWVDNSLQNWNAKMPFSAGDRDVAEIDAATGTVSRSMAGVGSHIFALAANPANGTLAIVGSNARNLIPFEPKVRGYLVETILKTWTTLGTVSPARVLNPHIVYETLPAPPVEADSALGQPMGAEYSPTGGRLYVACMSTDKIGVSSGILTSWARIPTVQGPSGLKLDQTRSRLYVLGRFRNQIQTFNIDDFSTVGVANLGFDPTPDVVVNGRRHFYAGRTSGHGDQSCNTCHLFGDADQLAWDLGNPPGDFEPPPVGQPDPLLTGFDPMKGPIVTQTLRGMATTEPFHWRGDRQDIFAFNPAFQGLMGLPAPLPDSEMTAFAQFVMSIQYPPNPYQNLDRTQVNTGTIPNPASGESLFVNRVIHGAKKCVDCHMQPEGTNRLLVNAAEIQESQDLKVPQLRNLYQKLGSDRTPAGTSMRGYGFTHDGTQDNLFHFLQSPRFSFTAGSEGDDERRNVEAFLLAFDTGMHTAVGRRVTFDGANNGDGGLIATLDTLVGQADLNAIDLVAKGVQDGQQRGWVYVGGGFRSDRYGEGLATPASLRGAAAPGEEITFMAVPEGSGTRIGVDRDRDGYYDRDELDISADPEDPASPGPTAVDPAGVERFGLRAVRPSPFRAHTEVDLALPMAGRVDLRVYDLLGREVRAVARGMWLAAGPHTLAWDGRRDEGGAAAPGVYFVKLRAPGLEQSRTVITLP